MLAEKLSQLAAGCRAEVACDPRLYFTFFVCLMKKTGLLDISMLKGIEVTRSCGAHTGDPFERSSRTHYHKPWET